MIDKIINMLDSDPSPIPIERFREWQNHPVTEELKKNLLVQYMQLSSSQPPDTVQEAALFAHRVYSVQSLLDEIENFEPRGLIKEDNDEA